MSVSCDSLTGEEPIPGTNCTLDGGGKRRGKKKRKSGKKRGMNLFFKLMLAAKKKRAPSFQYKNKTYYGHPHPMLGMVYKASKSPLKDVKKNGTVKRRKRGKSKKRKSRRRSKSSKKRRSPKRKSRSRRRR